MAFTGPQFFPPLGAANSQPPIKPTGWDRCVLAGQELPAYAKVLNASCELKRDPKRKRGADGANPTYSGLDPKPLSIELTTFNDADREALAAILLQYVPQPGRKPQSVSIDHPSLRMLGISAVDIIGATALIPEGRGSTTAKMTLNLVHSLPAKKGNAVVTPMKAPVRHPKRARRPANPPPTQTKNFSSPDDALMSGG